MPVTRGEKRGFIVFGVVMLALMTLVAWLASEKSEKGDGFPSSNSTLRNGGKAAFLLLQQSGYPVERWKEPPTELPSDTDGVLLIIAGPESLPRGEHYTALSRFLLRGGRILIVGALPSGFVPQAAGKEEEERVGYAECTPAAPTHLTRGGTISQDGSRVWAFEGGSHLVHFKDKDDNPVVVSYSLGKGQVIWWASALPLTNAGIRDRHNLDLFLNSVGDSKRILWDEYYHEQHSYQSGRETNPPAVLWALVQAGFLGLLVILTYSRRSGPLVAVARDSRLSPLEFVETLGNVFHRARSNQVAVEIAFGRFQQVAARRLGIRGSANSTEIATAMEQRGLPLPAELAVLVRGSEDAAADPELSEKRALQLVQALSLATQSLDPRAAIKRTK